MDEALKKKLRYRGGQAAILNAPEGYASGLEAGDAGADNACEFVMLYVRSAAELGEWLPKAVPQLADDAVFWIAYPKQSSKLNSDLNRDILAELVQNKSAYRPVSQVVEITRSGRNRGHRSNQGGIHMNNATPGALPDIRQSVFVSAPIGKVWAAVATAEGLAAWFMPSDFQPVLGHEFHLEAGPFGKSPCKVTVLDPPNRLAFRWGKDWTLSFELAERDGGTEVTLLHSGWNETTLTEFGQPHPIVRGHMNEGWAKMTGKLRTHVEAQ